MSKKILITVKPDGKYELYSIQFNRTMECENYKELHYFLTGEISFIHKFQKVSDDE